MLTALLLLSQCSWQLSILELSSLLRLCFFWRSPNFHHYDLFFFRSPQHLYLCCSIWPTFPPSNNAALLPHTRLQTLYPSSDHFVTLLWEPSAPFYVSGCFSTSPATYCFSDSLRNHQCNAGCLRSRNVKLPHFVSLHPVDLTCI